MPPVSSGLRGRNAPKGFASRPACEDSDAVAHRDCEGVDCRGCRGSQLGPLVPPVAVRATGHHHLTCRECGRSVEVEGCLVKQ